MKHFGVLLFFCLCVLECSAKNGVDTLCIRFLSWDTYNLPHIVTCNNFEDELPYTEHRVCSKTAVVKLLESLKELRQTVDTDFSVGCKLFFLSDGNVVKTGPIVGLGENSTSGCICQLDVYIFIRVIVITICLS